MRLIVTRTGTGHYLIASVMLLVLQCGCAMAWPTEGWVTCAGIGGQFVLGTIYCLPRSRNSALGLRRKWLLTALSFTLWAAGFCITWWAEYVLGVTPAGAWAQDVVFAIRSLPLLLAVCWPDDDSMPMEQWIDVAQVTLIAALLMLLMFPGFTLRPTALLPPLNDSKITLLLDCANGIAAVVAVLACFAAQSPAGRVYRRAVAVCLCTYLVGSAFTNHVVILRWDAPAGSLWFLPASLAIPLFLASLRFSTDEVSRSTRLRDEVGQGIRVGSAVVYTFVTFLLSGALSLYLRHATTGIVLGTLSLLLYAARTSVMQVRHSQARRRMAHLNESLQELSERDALTGTRNRRWFKKYALDLWRSPALYFPLTMLLIDVDYFKRFNDQHGHAHGDECLSQVAGILAEVLEEHGGILARYGGEEFAVLLPRTSISAAHACAQETCDAVLAAHLPHSGSPLGVVTVSIGVSTFLEPAPQHLLPGVGASEMIVLLADAALYEAKRMGRSRAHAIHTV